MAKLFTYNFSQLYIKNTPTVFFLSVYFLLFYSANALQFQCYQKFANSKPQVLLKFSIPSKELHFQEINKQCIATTELQIQFVKNYQIIFEKKYHQSYQLFDYQDQVTTILVDSITIQGLDYGEYEVHFSLEQFPKAFYQKKEFIFENQWYRVNIHDIEIFDKNYFPIFNIISNQQDSIFLKFFFESDYSFPLTIRIQVFTAQSEQSNNYAVAYQSIYQQTSTINLKKGKNQKWVKLPIEKIPDQYYFVEVNFFEEENFVLSKRLELEFQRDKNSIKKQLLEIAQAFHQLGINLPLNFEKTLDELIDYQKYTEMLLERSKKNPLKLRTLLNYGIPDKILNSSKEEIWFYFKYNRKFSFILS